MAKKPAKKKVKDVTGEEVVQDKDLEKVVGGYAPKLTMKVGAATCTCKSCGLSATIKTDNYNQASDPDT